MDDPAHRRSRTLEQVHEALESLKPLELIRLRESARFLMRALGNKASADEKDLLQESIARTLSGARHCPDSIDFSAHLDGAMRSIASSWAKERDATFSPGSYAGASPSMGTRGLGSTDQAFSPSIDRILIGKQELERVSEVFREDATLVKIIECWALGMGGPEIQENLGMTDQAYRAATKRLRRIV